MNTGQAMEKDKALEALSIWPVRGPFALKVLFAGDGVGAMSGDGISCSGDRCLGVYYSGETITITAQGSADAVFDGWTGCPSASGSECSIIVGADLTITATFLAAKSIWDKPSSLNFGKVGKNVPSPVKYIAVKNLKATNLQIGAVSIIGTNFGEFVFVPEEYCSGVTLLPGQTCTIALNINAQEYGTRRAQLVVTSNDARAPEKIIKLTAKALPAKVHVAPKSLSFGRVNAQGSADQQLTIENKGVTPLSVSSITSIGDDGGNFTFNPAGCPDLQEGESCSLTVTFTPGAIGKRTGTLGITSNAPKKSTVNVKMKGEGI
jgi:hypothetical protein